MCAGMHARCPASGKAVIGQSWRLRECERNTAQRECGSARSELDRHTDHGRFDDGGDAFRAKSGNQDGGRNASRRLVATTMSRLRRRTMSRIRSLPWAASSIDHHLQLPQRRVRQRRQFGGQRLQVFLDLIDAANQPQAHRVLIGPCTASGLRSHACRIARSCSSSPSAYARLASIISECRRSRASASRPDRDGSPSPHRGTICERRRR